jgi:hypothetical protein
MRRFKLFSSLRVRILHLFLLMIVVGVFPTPAFAHPFVALPSLAQAPSKLDKQVRAWVEQLAKQKPFSAWQTADPQIEALGPGTHSWLVLFTEEGQNIGYMVVHAITDGSFQLGEYGVGPYPLFSRELLRQSLLDNGLISTQTLEQLTAIKHYIHPFAAMWEVTIGADRYWLDAKTAELIPMDAALWQQAIASTSEHTYLEAKGDMQIANLQLNELFDAYERLPWLTKEAPFPAKNAKKLQARLDNKQQLRYVIEPFGDVMLYAVPVTGYQRWSNGRIDISVDMKGTRFIPLGDMLQQGLFYR